MKRNLQKGILVTSACAAFLLGNVQQAYAVAADAIEIVQQNKKIAGTVVDQNGEAVIGANVIQKGTTNGTITDIDGKFTLEVPAKAVLTVSFIGYQSQEVALKGNETQLTVTLKDDTEVLDEVVVVGYGTMKKRDLSGAVSQIKSDDLMKGNPTDLSQGLAGKVAGVQINAADGAPGGGVSIQVRGTNSFSTSSQPLFIVDGVPFDAGSTPASDANQNSNNTSNPLSFINPHDIQSIEVLKDASATAIYGSRGANGVVIITTKRGEAGYEQVEFSSNFSFSRIANKVKVLDAATYASYINEQDLNSYQYDGKPYAQLSYPGMWSYPSLPDGTLDYENGKYLPSPEDYRNPGYYTDEYGNQTWVGGADWQDLIYQNGFSQEYNLSVSGGSEKGWHAFSGNFLNQDGIIKESGFTRYALRANIGRKMYKWLEMGMNINFTHTETDFSKTNSNDYGVIRSSLIFPPNYDPTHMDQTTNDELSWLASNPYAYINDTKDHLKAINVFTSSYAEVKLFPFLKFRQNLGISYTNNNRGTYFGQQTQEGSGQNGINGKAGQSDNWYMGITTESLFTFDKTFGVHGINAVAGFTAEKTNWGSKSMSATGFPNDLTQDYDMSLGTKPGKLQSDRGDAALASFLGRINYTLLDKYIFTASYRTDGSSKFTDANKWAGFLSGAFAWRMSEEKFIKNLNLFSNLKFRASYGETGNQGIGSYRTLPMLSVANYPFAGGINSGFAQVDWRGPVADDLRWETTAQYNVGLDMGFLNGRIFKEQLFDVILAPKNGKFITYRLLNRIILWTGNSIPPFSIRFINTEFAQQFIIHMKTALCVGMLCTSPYILYQLFRFVSPALYDNERRYVIRMVGGGYAMFSLGVLVSYFLIFPLTFRFLGTYQVNGDVDNLITFDSYISTLVMMCLAMGVIFEISILSWLFAKLGFLSADFMRKYRKHAIVIILVVAAIITPTSDVFTLSLVALPMWVLYEMSIWIVKNSKMNEDTVAT